MGGGGGGGVDVLNLGLMFETWLVVVVGGGGLHGEEVRVCDSVRGRESPKPTRVAAKVE